MLSYIFFFVCFYFVCLCYCVCSCVKSRFPDFVAYVVLFDIDVCVSVLYITSICVHASFYCTGLVGFDVCVLKFSTDVSRFS